MDSSRLKPRSSMVQFDKINLGQAERTRYGIDALCNRANST